MSDAPDSPPTDLTLEQALTLAQSHWNAGQAQQAEHWCRQILTALPNQPDALNLLAVIAHAYRKPDLAIELLRQACQGEHASANHLSNLAEMCRQQGLLDEARQAGERAVARDPELLAGWSNLGIILQECGQLEYSRECLQRALAMEPESALTHNNLANTYRRLYQLELAASHYQQALALDPGYAEAHSNLAFLQTSEGQFELAAQSARRAIDLNPQFADAYLNLAEAESARLNHAQALHWLNALLSFAPQYVAGLSARALVLKRLGRLEEALVCARQAVDLAPANAKAHFDLGLVLQALEQHEQALRHYEQAAGLPGVQAEQALLASASLFLELGRADQANDYFDRALKAFPDSFQALVARSDSKKYRTGDGDIAAMEALLAGPRCLALNERLAVHFALGKAYLDTADSARAFVHLDAGNGLKRATFDYDAKATGQWVREIIAAFPAERFTRPAASRNGSALPVFVLGMPRSGTSLIEQILASHPEVQGAGELAALRLVIEARGPFPGNPAHGAALDLQGIGADYLAAVEPLARGKSRLVDKMPANFFYAALIPLILPGAFIIHCRRDPVDTCLSCYSKQFGGEQRFSYNQTELGQFHRDYQTLMAHLRRVLPAERFIEVDYEAVVDDLEGQARRLLEFIGLPWDAACLDFHSTERVVRTASTTQVRQPIYRTSKGRWHAHAEHLGPLLAALGVAKP
ncbi:sulfotransferase [Aquipseudomonas campi]